ncbi:MAG: ABC transporter permease subunit [Nostoc sp.]|uniref:ABC transporter permease n=1 Tax=Nostoc sp. TaxID=1180 RepID=UPI002FFC38AC
MMQNYDSGYGFSSFRQNFLFWSRFANCNEFDLNPLPAIAILPLVIIWFGFTSVSMIVVTAHATTWPIALNTEMGLSTVGLMVLMVGKNPGLDGFRLIREIMLPAALPHILTGLRTAWAFSWRTVIASELVFDSGGATSGLGWQINNSRYFL